MDTKSLRKTYELYYGQDMAANAVIKCLDRIETLEKELAEALNSAEKAINEWKKRTSENADLKAEVQRLREQLRSALARIEPLEKDNNELRTFIRIERHGIKGMIHDYYNHGAFPKVETLEELLKKNEKSS